MASYPLLFTYRDTLFGAGFVVEVVTTGRALGVDESDGSVWIYGVNPGAIAEYGATLIEAHAAFRDAYRKVLLDTANSTGSYEEFKREVERFFHASDNDAARWAEAVAAVREGRVDAALPRERADSPRGVRVSIKPMAEVTSHDNQPEVVAEALAA
jgi:hypothetical protein